MAEYSFICAKCDNTFSIFEHRTKYTGKAKCPKCKKISKQRDFSADLPLDNIIKGDDQLKTVGDLAKRNTDRLSPDEKRHILAKRDANKIMNPNLPKGMKRMIPEGGVDKLRDKKVRKANRNGKKDS